jgi:DsbC/DsbD-like thiol-disulfide interchange protein
MSKSILHLGVLGAFLVLFSAHVSAQTVSGSIGDGTIRRGGTAKGAIILTIPGDLHVNSNTPDSKYAIPTTVRLSGTGIRLGAVSYPKGKKKKFSFSETPINVYEGKVEFPFDVTVPSSFKGDTVEVKASVRYQACNDEVCFPPRTREVVMTVRVR